MTDEQGAPTKVGDWRGRLPTNEASATREHRVHQGVWRTDVAQWPAGEPQNDARVRAKYPTLPNWLAETHQRQNVRDIGLNLMSPEARQYAKDRLRVLDRIDGKAEQDRLWRNLLSSQPLAFSIAGHLRSHREDAAELFSGLIGSEVVGLARLDPGQGEWEDYLLAGIEAEWFPPRAQHTNDMSGADIAACLELAHGGRALLTIEVKYTDTFSAKPVDWTRYADHLSALGLDESATSALVGAGCSQVLRQVMMTDSVRRRGLSSTADPAARVDAGLAVVLAREDDRKARHVVEVLHQAVGDSIPVHFWSHRELLAASIKLPGLNEWAEQMINRYIPAGFEA